MENKEWFEYQLEDIKTPADFEEAIEEAYTVGFADGQGEAAESEYSDGYHNGIRFEQDRILALLEEASRSFKQYDLDAVATTNFLIRLTQGENK